MVSEIVKIGGREVDLGWKVVDLAEVGGRKVGPVQPPRLRLNTIASYGDYTRSASQIFIAHWSLKPPYIIL